MFILSVYILSFFFIIILLVIYYRKRIQKVLSLIEQQYEYLKKLYFRFDFLILTDLQANLLLLKDALVEKDRILGKTLDDELVEFELSEDYTVLPLIDYIHKFPHVNSGVCICSVIDEENKKIIVPLIEPKDYNMITEGLKMMKEVIKKYETIQKMQAEQLKNHAKLQRELVESLSKNLYDVAYMLGWLYIYDDKVLYHFTRGYNDARQQLNIEEVIDVDKMSEYIEAIRIKLESIPEDKKKVLYAVLEEIVYDILSREQG